MIVGLLSCASKEGSIFSSEDKKKDDIEKSFNLSGDQFKKFKVKEVPVSKETEIKTSKKVEDKKINLPVKVLERKKKPVSKKNLKAQKKSKTNIKEDKTKTTKALTQERPSSTPKVIKSQEKTIEEISEEYPPEFLKYDEQAKHVWEKYSRLVFPGEESVFVVRFLGIVAGHIKIKTHGVVKVGDREAYHYSARLKSAEYYNFVYSLDDGLDSFVDVETLLPIKYTLRQRESGQSVDDLQLFDNQTQKSYFWYKRLKKGQTKKIEKETLIPRLFQDSFSALMFVRGLPMIKDSIYKFPIVTRGKIWILEARVHGSDEVKVKGEWVKSWKIKAVTRFPGVLKKKGDILFWYSKDARRSLLKFKAKVKIGSIEGELQ
jgi:hypothetical protein